ncbi:unnamed protein product [Protopolystoma xenopodis]|uniref:Uncharacterized protein n=1 Tax=Protopolystoma xenopodis TaxID=117903 RepID=A0A3S5CTI8_9PLAT|nr:unnamed protein product [Protopolystoma xenopodis]
MISGGQFGRLRVWDSKSQRCIVEIRGPLDRCVSSDALGVSVNELHTPDYGLHSIMQLHIDSTFSCKDDKVGQLILVRQSNHVEFYNLWDMKLDSERLRNMHIFVFSTVLTPKFLGDIGQVQQLCVAGRSHSRLVLADSSDRLKIFLRPPGLTKSANAGWACHLVPDGHSAPILDLAVSTCGEWLATGARDNAICLWRIVETTDEAAIDEKPSDVCRDTVKVILIAHQLSAHAAHVTAVCFDR